MTQIHIRHIEVEDAQSYLELCKEIDAETAFMLRDSGERRTTIEQQRSQLESVVAAPNQTIFVAEADGELVGYLAAFGGGLNRIRHSAHLVAGVLQRYANRGVGTALFETLVPWATEAGLRRLDLTVMTHNQRAVHLYQKMGFQIEGKAIHALCVNGEYVDEFYMAKLL